MDKKDKSVANENRVIYTSSSRRVATDVVLTEQPLLIRLNWQTESINESKIFTITMRTIGDEKYLIMGLLLSEGVIRDIQDVVSIIQDESDDVSSLNSWEATLSDRCIPNFETIERFQPKYSSCGICGTTSIKSLEVKSPPKLNERKHWLSKTLIFSLSESMKKAQKLFHQTGGSHASGCFNENGELIAIKEDIVRHNAMDKLIGELFYKEMIPVQNESLIIVLSGRISFELVQKAVMAGISVIIAIGSPSDLAISTAKRFNLTLIGFVTSSSFNLYHGEWRIEKEKE